ncbi:molybdopterin molybdotransferase MoeA [Archaeoglobus profundus]|uniref:molybdopterin molybdotransferase n=1 Tax=Archaeoglobus profundus (strain DSM 5631 / JCM 9629 / NBRC 100127 / Av18) TaxID=572546 RepID=D2RHD7_ARCPA|nr:gephyrin-like molybdotransferase Glp [Archaeoglobus profundus]ADB57712.1 molybdenum cofactor synthesis domain protein [Archaeoglobus profundus DSM 5631]
MVRLRGFKERTIVRDAVKALEGVRFKRVDSEIVEITRACGRILAEDIIAKYNVPHFDRSAVDGYAVVAEDTFGANLNNPVMLKIVGEVEMGEEPIEMSRGTAVRVSTGSALPKGANAVVMLEYTKEVGEFVEIYRPVVPFENVSREGEDIKAGEVVLKAGEILQPQDIGVLASLGYAKVKVLKKPRVVIISTGNELVEIGEELEVGKVVNSNAYMLFCALKMYNCEPSVYGIVRDDFDELKKAIIQALSVGDCVITTGGTSVGKGDLVPEVVKEIGKIVFHGISIKPGMPTGLGVIDGKPVLMLSGFPVACLIGFELIFPHVLAKLTGVRVVKRRGEGVKAKLKRRIPSKAGVRTFARVIYKDGFAEPLMTSGSGILTSMVRANGIVVVPEEKEGFEEGEEVNVVLVRDLIEEVT